MAEMRVMGAGELAAGEMRVVTAGETEVLLLRTEEGFAAVQPKCPHAGAPLAKGAICDGRLVCPWHMATFALPGGGLVEPPAMCGLTTYRVRLEGDGVMVDPEAVAPVTRARDRETEKVVMLVGAGAAGAMAAVTLREEGFGGRIVVVDPVAEEPVDRTQLSKMALAGKMPLEKIRLGVMEDAGVERVTERVERLSAAEGTALLSDGSTMKFDRALVATGGVPERIEVPGAELGYVIRHTEDVAAILTAAEGRREVVVVGTSFLGLEAASALVQKGMSVTVVGPGPITFETKFGKEVADAVQALHAEKGTKFRLGVEVVRIEEDAVVVRAGDGKEARLMAEVVILATGVRPALGFAHDLPMAERGGVRVDAGLRAAGTVWVAGDIAAVDGVRIEHWRLAEQHGRVAAKAMLGDEVRYEGVPFFWTFHFGKRMGYLGHAEGWDEIVIDGDVAGMEFMTFYVKGGVVEAVLSCGRDTAMAGLAEGMRGRLTVEEVRRVGGGLRGTADSSAALLNDKQRNRQRRERRVDGLHSHLRRGEAAPQMGHPWCRGRSRETADSSAALLNDKQRNRQRRERRVDGLHSHLRRGEAAPQMGHPWYRVGWSEGEGEMRGFSLAQNDEFWGWGMLWRPGEFAPG